MGLFSNERIGITGPEGAAPLNPPLPPPPPGLPPNGVLTKSAPDPEVPLAGRYVLSNLAANVLPANKAIQNI